MYKNKNNSPVEELLLEIDHDFLKKFSWFVFLQYNKQNNLKKSI